jgi:hypothetical protein
MINVVENLGPGLRQVKQGGVFFFYCTLSFTRKEMIEDTKRVIRSCKLKKDNQYNGHKKRTKLQTMIYKTLNRELKI